MDLTPHIFNAQVMHKRLFPQENAFQYRVYYLALPLPAPKIKRNFLKFDPKDIGFRDGRDPDMFAQEVLEHYGLANRICNITLITMPKVLGYVFNPVSFYFCFEHTKKILAVIAEVHNTFGEQHTYLCANQDHSSLDANQWLEAQKVFHVSPFLPRAGTYRFRFSLQKSRLGIWINYYDDQNKKQLVTALTGSLIPLNPTSLRQSFWQNPFLTLKVSVLIHWQALKLLYKHGYYFKKPKQHLTKLSATLAKTKSSKT